MSVKVWKEGGMQEQVQTNPFEGKVSIRAKLSKSAGLGLFIVQNSNGYRVRPGGIIARITAEGTLEVPRMDRNAAIAVGLEVDGEGCAIVDLGGDGN